MKRAYLIIILALFNLLYSLAMYIGSISFGTDGGYGFFNANMDYMIWFISSIFVLIIGLIDLKKEKELTK